MLRQAVFGRLAGYEDVNDAERLRQFVADYNFGTVIAVGQRSGQPLVAHIPFIVEPPSVCAPNSISC